MHLRPKGAASLSEERAMFAVCVTFHIKQELMDAFLPLMHENAQSSLSDEPDCHRFDVCTNPESAQVFLYELYSDAAAFQAHLQTPHFKSFDAATSDMIEKKDVTTFADVFQAG